MKETQATIENWRAMTFGGRPTPINMAVRANEEMAELIRAVTKPDARPDDIADEAADVLIVLYGLARMTGFNLHDAVDRKMAINRARRWSRDPKTGRTHHVLDDGEAEA